MSRANRAAIQTRAPTQATTAIRRGKNTAMPARRFVGPATVLEVAHVVRVDERDIEVQVPSRGPSPLPAQSLVPFSDLACEDPVVVAHLSGAEPSVVVLGRLFNPLAPPRDVRVNGRKVAIEANTELTLRCADATIRIAHDGLVAVRGKRVVTQARGVNRIRGGSVEIN